MEEVAVPSSTLQRTKAIRREIHQHPELSTKEYRTQELVRRELESLGIETRTMAGTGVVGLLRCGKAREERTIALRADMDALPVQEDTGAPFASVAPGAMHACGHDCHTAILLGTAMTLVENSAALRGNVKFIFQPAEEYSPVGGAKRMIDEGVLTDPKVDFIIGLHVWPDLPLGTVGVRVGPMMAATDRVDIHVYGRGGHGARPHQAVDAIVAAGHLVSAIQSIVSRSVDPLKPVVLTFGAIRGGVRYNVIADQVYLEGTCRTLDPDVRQSMPSHVQRLARGICEAFGASCQVDYAHGYPVLVNHPDAVRLVEEGAAAALGPEGVIRVDEPSMTAEDFAYFSQEVPGCFFWLGSRESSQEYIPLHNPRFLPDERCLGIGVRVLYETVRRYLS